MMLTNSIYVVMYIYMGKSNITKKNKTNVKVSKWTGSVFILGDKQNLPTKHTFIIKLG